jgi:ABC-type amino acid transport substrate-binding protein
VVLGVSSSDSHLLTTRPYYRSSYVFVQRADRGTPVRSLEDPRLEQLRVGIQEIGGDYIPPAVALARRGFQRQISVSESSSHDLIQAVADGRIDLAIAWGPLAKVNGTPLTITPVPVSDTTGSARFAYDIAMGVGRNDSALRYALDQALLQRHTEIAAILARYGVPIVSPDPELATRK